MALGLTLARRSHSCCMASFPILFTSTITQRSSHECVMCTICTTGRSSRGERADSPHGESCMPGWGNIVSELPV
eukprot:scaffold245763_cov31-Tisochrysis_lutea.AAC.2